MEKLTLEEILTAVAGDIVKDGKAASYENISTDTRTIKPESIFIALKGENFNGNNYAAEASIKGALVCIVDELKCNVDAFYRDTVVIKVEDTKVALNELARYYRSRLKIKVIGITGSTGKTSTKDLVAAVLSSRYKVFKTKGNFNNEIGLPLMIFNLDSSYDVAVLEMGMSSLGEIHRLANTARPDIGIITNIGVSHIEYLKTRENILKAKLEITDFFSKDNTLIINGDNDLLSTLESNKFNIIRIGMENKRADYFAADVSLLEEKIMFKAVEASGMVSPEFSVNIPGKHNILNSLLAIACGKKLGLSLEEMVNSIKNLEFTSMRLDIVKGNDFTIIDDSYNASPDSMKAAIDVLVNMNGLRKIAVLGTMRELGEESYILHKEIGKYAKEKNVDMLLAIGEYCEAYIEGFEDKNKFAAFKNNENVISYLEKAVKLGDVLLVKASRSMKFENIVSNLKIKMS